MSAFRFAKDYAFHRLKAKTRHGTHSPFVYRLVDEVIYDFSKKKVYAEVETMRKGLLSDSHVINVRLGQLLYRLAADLRPANMIVLGAGLELLSVYLKKASPDAGLYNLEDDTLPKALGSLDKVDFAFIGENPAEQTAFQYFESFLPKVHDGTLLIFNNIYRSEGTKKAWKAIKAHPQVTVSIDLFWIGLVYFRRGQVKEDFLIKF